MYEYDEQRMMMECLAAENRQEIKNTFIKNLGIDVYKGHMRQYNRKCQKLPQLLSDTVDKSLKGSTFMDIEDSYHAWCITKKQNAGSSTANDSDETRVQFPVQKLILNVIHPFDEYGMLPYSIKIPYNADPKEKLFLTVVNAIVNCRPVHRNILSNFVINGAENTGNLLKAIMSVLGFEQTRGDSSPSQVRNTMDLALRNVESLQQKVAHMLTQICPEIEDDDLITTGATVIPCANTLSLPHNNIVIIVNDDEKFVTTHFPEEIGPHHLLFLFLDCSNASPSSYATVSRWSRNFKYWRFCDGQRPSPQPSKESPGKVLFAIYALPEDKRFKDTQVLASLGGQQKIICEIHSTDQHHHVPLIKIPKTHAVPCGVYNTYAGVRKQCGNASNWRCPEGLTTEASHCLVGVCNICYKRNAKSDRIVRIPAPRPQDMRKKALDSNQVGDSDEDSDDNQSPETTRLNDDDVGISRFVSAVDDEFTVDEEPINFFELPTGDDFIGEQEVNIQHSRLETTLLYDVKRSLRSHYLLNNSFGILKRGVPRYASNKTSLLFNQCVRTGKSPAVSLLWTEANLFPTIFFKNYNESIPGALPFHMYDAGPKKHLPGTASLLAHNRVRLYDGDLQTSRSFGYLHFMFDIVANDRLNHQSSELVFRRGFEHLAEKGGIGASPMQTVLEYDEFDSSRKIKELAAMMKKAPWHTFYTAKYELDYDKYADKYFSNMVLMNRIWERTVHYLTEFLEKSPSKIMGGVYGHFSRIEFQSAGSPGNKCHVHGGINNKGETAEQIVSRICCDPRAFFTPQFGTDYESLLKDGLVENKTDFWHLERLIEKLTIHDCERAGERCKKPRGESGNLVCRVRSHPYSYKYWYEEKENLYDEETMLILEKVELAKQNPLKDILNDDVQWDLDPCLQAGNWHYPAPPQSGRRKIIPTIPILAVMMRCCSNVQGCDRRFSTSYLVKYNVGKEPRKKTNFKATKDPKEVIAETSHFFSLNEKLQSVKNRIKDEQKKMKKEQQQNILEVAMTEMVWFLCGFAYTHSNASFVHINTLPPEYRATYKQSLKFNHPSTSPHLDPGAVGNDIDPNHGRTGLPIWRQFTKEQVQHAREYNNSNLCYGATEKFNVRPPELLAFNSIQIFTETFKNRPPELLAFNSIQIFTETFLMTGTVTEPPAEDAKVSQWIDALGRRYKIRDNELEQALLFIQHQQHPSRPVLQEILTGIKNGDPILQKRFLHITDYNLTVAVISNVTPLQKLRFLFHTALTLGAYVCELELFPKGDMKQAFVAAKLVHDPPTQGDVNQLLKRLVSEQYAYLPITAKKLSSYIKITNQALSDYFLGNHQLHFSVPSISEIALREEAEEQLQNCLHDSEDSIRNVLLETVYKNNLHLPGIPTLQQFKEATIQDPLQWIPQLTRAPAQSDKSVREQESAMNLGVTAILKYLDPTTTGVKHVLFTGPPGAGKSKLTEVLTLFAISKGLTVVVTSLASERSRSCGGRHIHLLFPMRVTMNKRNHPLLDAQDCIRNLTKNPIKLLILQRTNVFIFEEIGLVSSEMFAVLDSVMKYVMSCDLPFGGKLVIANGNHVQLQPIEGRPFWMSTHFMMSFDAIVLKEYVRMANDPDLQHILQLLRKPIMIGEERKQVLDAIEKHCEFVDSWNQVPSERMRVLTTKKAQENINNKFLEDKLNQPNLRCVKSKSTDEILEGDRWKPCSGFRQKSLNRNASEPQEMILFKDAIMCFTYNCNEGNAIFSQGGLCIVKSIPEEFNPDSKVTVIIVPPGETNIFPPPRHWQQIQIGRRQGIPILVGPGIFARRTQYPFRYYTVQNFHRVMGCTAQGGIATQLSVVTKEFRMWDLGQLIVLLSRVTNMKMITFVGSKQDNLNAVEEIMTKEGKFTEAITERLVALDVLTSPPQRIITEQANPFVPIRREIPNVAQGYVYLLVCIHEPYRCQSSISQTFFFIIKPVPSTSKDPIMIHLPSVHIALR
ncbi:unnamed protein product [Cyprideis torosa]|uniref:ATP-dependent DNA helicase n=1 Tax=Cyprideis torosa TaxID=163714 RepID=A0A7R8WJG3_9CRUS|nr:unnamed protein product [Cyprideis torosa]CAG0901954.1 unnamed protein product [Cyprideis torosa]